MRTRVKICGLTRREDVSLAVRLGADALGFNCFEGSPRYLAPGSLASLVDQVPPFVTRVGLFVNADVQVIQERLNETRFDLLQFHGDEDNRFCGRFGLPFIKVIRVKHPAELAEACTRFPDARAILADAHVAGVYGGTGRTLDWSGLPGIDKPLILAGGLEPGNVEAAIREVRPWCVDVSSGVEQVAGQKDGAAMQAFFDAVRAADRSG